MIKYLHSCGWYREWSEARPDQWLRVIEHPIYGKVDQLQLVEREKAHHSCDAYRDAVARLQERLSKRRGQSSAA